MTTTAKLTHTMKSVLKDASRDGTPLYSPATRDALLRRGLVRVRGENTDRPTLHLTDAGHAMVYALLTTG